MQFTWLGLYFTQSIVFYIIFKYNKSIKRKRVVYKKWIFRVEKSNKSWPWSLSGKILSNNKREKWMSEEGETISVIRGLGLGYNYKLTTALNLHSNHKSGIFILKARTPMHMHVLYGLRLVFCIILGKNSFLIWYKKNEQFSYFNCQLLFFFSNF